MVSQFETTLATPLNQGDTGVSEIFVASLKTAEGHTVTTADFPFGVIYIVIEPKNSNFEIIKCTGIDASGIGFTGPTRGLPTYISGGETTVAANVKAHSAGVDVIITDNVNWFLEHFADLHTNQVIGGVKTFSSSPVVPTGGSGTQAANAQDIANAISGANATASNVTAGTVKTDQVPNSLPRVLNVYVQQQSAPGMTLKVLPFTFVVGLTQIAFAGGNTSTITAPVSNPRIDLVVVTTAGSLAIRTGAEAVSPAVPVPTDGDVVLAQIFNRVGETSIKDQNDSTNGFIQNWLTPSAYSSASTIPTGTVMQSALRSAPTGWLPCDGSAQSRASFASLFSKISPSLGTVTVTIASPGVFTLNGHGLVAGDQIYFTTSGALPTGLSINTIYFVIATGLTTNAFEVSATRGGSAINTTGTQSGTHTAVFCPWGLGDGTTTFNLPDMRGRVAVGQNTGTFTNLGLTGGEETHALATGEMPNHAHSYSVSNQGGGGTGSATGGPANGVTNTGSAGSGTAHNNLQPYNTYLYIIKS